MTCPSCGANAPADARFCPACGHALIARPDERRVATVLFADLVGFTSYSESTDPEHVKNLVDRCFERLAADVTTFGGQVDKVIGDALVAIFGAPVAHEDDAERAVRAALRMQERIDEVRAETGVDVRMRVGVNTGEVLVGALRAGGDYTAMGDVVNTASRLQDVAAPGQVVVGPATHAATSRGVRYEPLGAVSVKGREEPVRAWLAEEAIAPPGRRRDLHRTPLVGREGELAVLRASLASAIARNRAHLVLIAGEAGVGKTRLAAELGREAECHHGGLVLTGHCIPYGETNVWWPLGAMVGEACGIEPTDPTALVAETTATAVGHALGLAMDDPEALRVTGGLLYLMGRGGLGSDVDPTRAREDALRSALAFFGALAQQRLLVLVLSDLHWADDELLEFLPRLLTHMAPQPLVLAATTRVEATGHWSPPTGRHNTVHLNLDPLEPADTDALLLGLLPDADDDLVAVLRERSGGNPFFIEELAAMVSDECEPGDGASELPATLHGLVAARLDRLTPTERAILEDAAVIGASGPVALVQALAGVRETEPGDGLERLADRDLLVLHDDEYSFRNELTREVAYGTLTKAERARRHGTLAKLLAEEGEASDRLEEVLDRLAYHFNLAASLMAELGPSPGLAPDMSAKAVQFLLRAAERAEQRENWKTAERYLSHIVPLVDPGDGALRLRVRLSRARARAEQRDTVGARRDLAEALVLAEELGDTAAVAAAGTILGDVEYKEGDLLASAATLDGAVDRWRALDDPRGLAEALRFRGMTDVFRGELDGAAVLLGEAMAIFRSIEDRRGEAWALQNLAWIAFVRGRHVEAKDLLDASAAAFGELGDWGGVAWALGLLAWVHFTQGRLEDAHELAEAILREAHELGNRWAAAIMQVLLANIALWRGQADLALHNASEARSVFQGLADAWGELQSLVPLTVALNLVGRDDDARAMLDVVDEVGERVRDSGMRALPELLRIVVAVQSGDPDALELANTLIPTLTEEAFVADERRTTLGLAQLQHGDVREAIETLEAAREIAGSLGLDAAASVALAAALVAGDRADDALALCTHAQRVVVTFVDRYRLEVARAFALHRTGELDAADAAIERARAIVDGTQSRLDQMLVRLAQAALWGSSSRAEASAAEALDRSEALRTRAIGWERAYALMAGTPG